MFFLIFNLTVRNREEMSSMAEQLEYIKISSYSSFLDLLSL